MKILRTSLFASVALSLLLSSCSNDDEGATTVTYLSPCQQIVLTETKTSDVQSIQHIQSYIFTNGLIAGAENSQSYKNTIFSGGETEEQVQTTTIERGQNTVQMTDSYDNVNTYTLGDNGMAVSCLRNEAGGSVRTYQFSYVAVDSKPMLSSITESIDGEEFSSIDITYPSTDAMHVVRKISGETLAYTVNMSGSGVVQNDYMLPALFLAEMHPLSLHLTALYGCMLGCPTQLLGGTVTPDDNLYNEKVSYVYSADDDGRPTRCRVDLVSDGSTYDSRTITIKVD